MASWMKTAAKPLESVHIIYVQNQSLHSSSSVLGALPAARISTIMDCMTVRLSLSLPSQIASAVTLIRLISPCPFGTQILLKAQSFLEVIHVHHLPKKASYAAQNASG